MTTPGYILTDAAEADLRGVIRYTRKEWGDAQARAYAAKLEKGIARLVAVRAASLDMSSLYPNFWAEYGNYEGVPSTSATATRQSPAGLTMRWVSSAAPALRARVRQAKHCMSAWLARNKMPKR